MRISDWSSDVCSSDLVTERVAEIVTERIGVRWLAGYGASEVPVIAVNPVDRPEEWRLDSAGLPADRVSLRVVSLESGAELAPGRSEGHTSELQSLMRISYAVFCLKKKKLTQQIQHQQRH